MANLYVLYYNHIMKYVQNGLVNVTTNLRYRAMADNGSDRA